MSTKKRIVTKTLPRRDIFSPVKAVKMQPNVQYQDIQFTKNKLFPSDVLWNFHFSLSKSYVGIYEKATSQVLIKLVSHNIIRNPAYPLTAIFKPMFINIPFNANWADSSSFYLGSDSGSGDVNNVIVYNKDLQSYYNLKIFFDSLFKVQPTAADLIDDIILRFQIIIYF